MMLHFQDPYLKLPSASLAEPPEASVIGAAASWLHGALLGTVATSVAVLAIFSIGLLMLSGRMNLRSGATVVAGCFVLFGASTIAEGIQSALHRPPLVTPPSPTVPPPPRINAPPPAGPADDPYAGAALPAQ